jgi:hypothetical protein
MLVPPGILGLAPSDNLLFPNGSGYFDTNGFVCQLNCSYC